MTKLGFKIWDLIGHWTLGFGHLKVYQKLHIFSIISDLLTKKTYVTLPASRSGGGMVYTRDLKSLAARLAGSSPAPSTLE